MNIEKVEWWYDCGNIAMLIRYLVERGDLDEDVSSISYLVEKPWKWTDEYEAMVAEHERVMARSRVAAHRGP